MPEYLNPHAHDLYLLGPDGNTVRIGKNKRVRLPAFFDRYIGKNFLQRTDVLNMTKAPPPPNSPAKAIARRQAALRITPHRAIPHRVKQQVQQIPQLFQQTPPRLAPAKPAQYKRIVGSGSRLADIATARCAEAIANSKYLISNGVGVGILTYNRSASLRRLVDSIANHTDLKRTTLFISDDGSTDVSQLALLHELSQAGFCVVLSNKKRLGVAGNSNRLLRCLSRFPKKILLNDDVEIKQRGWEDFYFTAMQQTGFHHFCYRQLGVYGAKPGNLTAKNGVVLEMVIDKPHGAVLALDEQAFAAAGYFDEGFGIYGMEHVDWSRRLANSGVQDHGYFDVQGSNTYFEIRSVPSSVEKRQELFSAAKARFNAIGERSGRIEASADSAVPRLSCVIPFRDIDRRAAILTVRNNIIAQRFPDIEIIMTEEDAQPAFSQQLCSPARYVFSKGSAGPKFNKSRAWNAGVALCTSDIVVLHDADMLIQSDYFEMIAAELRTVESCHIGKEVVYITKECTDSIVTTGMVDTPACNQVVSYFEGGSLACKVDAYWRVGGFVEDYLGYGNEDCDFYARLSKGSIWRENRHIIMLHLWHDRVPGWNQYHARNKQLEEQFKALPIETRITQQRQRLLAGPWARFLK